MAKYGMPYKGSKNKIADKIISVLPSAEYFVDLFGGGGAMTDCASQSGKYNKVIYNEIEPVVAKGFEMAVKGKFKGENRWISREDFFRLKDTDPYVAICWSFGNDLKTYLYGKDIEPVKKILHEICFSDNPHKSRLLWKEFIRQYNIYRYQDLERLQSLESLERLERLEKIDTISCDSYENVSIPENSVIYCDIPYKSTNKYLSEFDYDKFYQWCLNSDKMIFISEFDMPKEFHIIAEWDRQNSMAANGKCEKAHEKLYCNKPYSIDNQLEFNLGA